MNTTNNTRTLGYIAHSAAVAELMQRLIEERIARGDALELQDFTALTVHPKVVALFDRVDQDLYIREFVEGFKVTMNEMGLDGMEGAKQLIELATAAYKTSMPPELLAKNEEIYGDMMQRCYDAVVASFTH